MVAILRRIPLYTATITKGRGRYDVDDSLELFLLNVAAAVVVQDGKDLLDILGALLGEATHLEELLGAEAVRGCTQQQESHQQPIMSASMWR